MIQTTKDFAANTTKRMQHNVQRMPLTSVALAGVLGAGLMALMSYYGPLARRDSNS